MSFEGIEDINPSKPISTSSTFRMGVKAPFLDCEWSTVNVVGVYGLMNERLLIKFE